MKLTNLANKNTSLQILVINEINKRHIQIIKDINN